MSAGCLQNPGRKAFLCIKCQQDLSNCEKAQKQFNQLSTEIPKKVQAAIFGSCPSAQPIASGSITSHRQSAKRSYQQTVDEESTSSAAASQQELQEDDATANLVLRTFKILYCSAFCL